MRGRAKYVTWRTRIALGALLAATVVVSLAVCGDTAAAHEHAPDGAEHAAALFLSRHRDVIVSAALLLLWGVLFFRARMWDGLEGRGAAWTPTQPGWLAIAEKTTAGLALYACLVTGTAILPTIVQTVLAVAYLLAAFELLPKPLSSTASKVALACALLLAAACAQTAAGWTLDALVPAFIRFAHALFAGCCIGGAAGLFAALTVRPALADEQRQRLALLYVPVAALALPALLCVHALELAAARQPGDIWAELLTGGQFVARLALLAATAGLVALLYVRRRHALRLQAAALAIAFAANGLLPIVAPVAAVRLVEPVYWHVMGEQAHMTLRIDRDGALTQRVALHVWLPEATGAPQEVRLRLRQGDATVDVPLALRRSGADPFGFVGFDKHSYDGVGRFLSGKGQWELAVDVTDGNGGLFTYEKTEHVR